MQVATLTAVATAASFFHHTSMSQSLTCLQTFGLQANVLK